MPSEGWVEETKLAIEILQRVIGGYWAMPTVMPEYAQWLLDGIRNGTCVVRAFTVNADNTVDIGQGPVMVLAVAGRLIADVLEAECVS